MDDLLNRRLFEWSKKMILKIRPLRRLALRTRDEITQSYIEQIAELENQIELMQAQSIYLNFAQPGHYYSTIPNVNDLVKDQDRIFTTQERELPGVHIDLAAMLSLLERFKPLYSEFPFKDGPDPNLRFILDNGTYSVGDGVVLYSIMRLYNPRRIIEIGSGMSTCLMMDINDRFFDNGISITCIDPYPDRFQDMIAPQDEKLLKIIPQRLQDVDKDMFRSLDANDIVFVDSSHVSKCDSDVNHIFFDVLPYIKPGVLVHFHDIFYPFEYPKRWLLEVGAAWNENYLLHAFLLFNRKFEVLFFCDYLNHFYPEKIIDSIPVYMDMLGFNFWLRRV